jgi:O-Antigen ligase
MPAVLLLLAAVVGLLGQGAFYGPVQRLVGLLVLVAAAFALAGRPPERGDARLLPVVPALALGAWALADAGLLGASPAAAAGLGLLLAGVVAVLAVCRRLGREDRELLLAGLVVAGLVVAITAWLGVAWRVGALAWVGEGIWRGSSTLTYPNAAAAVLAPIALVTLARIDRARPSPTAVAAATGLLAGLGATLSRAGAVGFVAGLVALACLRGPRTTARSAAGPCAGAALALAGLVPSMPAGAPTRPALAVAGLVAGLTVAVLVARGSAVRAGGTLAAGVAWPLAGVVVVALLGGLALLGGAWAGEALRTVTGTRVSLASPDRTGALLAARQVLADHPVTGAGPGHTQLRWEGSDGVPRFFAYAHNEYVQVAAELGLVGLALLAVLLAALARLLLRSRPAGGDDGSWAGAVAAAVAFAVHGGFDFVWHLPAVVLTVTMLVGVVIPPPAPAPGTSASTPPWKELHEATT